MNNSVKASNNPVYAEQATLINLTHYFYYDGLISFDQIVKYLHYISRVISLDF